jgi:hypothetical protein
MHPCRFARPSLAGDRPRARELGAGVGLLGCLVGLLVAGGCGESKPANAAGTSAAVSTAGSTEVRADADADADELPIWQRKAIAMPATFTGFPRPDLGALDGVWIVDGGRPRGQQVWVFEDQGSKLTIVTPADGQESGQAEIHGVTLSSPCTLRLANADGDAESRALAQLGQSGSGRLILTAKGAVGVAAADGSLLACVGHRTFQITPDGLCRFTTEMLGVWADPVEAEAACALETTGEGKRLVIAGQVLREVEPGIWLDELAQADAVTPAQTREAALAAIQPELAETETGDESGESSG